MAEYRYQGQLWDLPDGVTTKEQARAAIRDGRARRKLTTPTVRTETGGPPRVIVGRT